MFLRSSTLSSLHWQDQLIAELERLQLELDQLRARPGGSYSRLVLFRGSGSSESIRSQLAFTWASGGHWLSPSLHAREQQWDERTLCFTASLCLNRETNNFLLLLPRSSGGFRLRGQCVSEGRRAAVTLWLLVQSAGHRLLLLT